MRLVLKIGHHSVQIYVTVRLNVQCKNVLVKNFQTVSNDHVA